MSAFDPTRIKTYSLKDRASKVRIDELASPHRKGGSFEDFFASLPNILAAKHLKDVAAAVVQARRDKRPVMLGMGAHPIKVGLTPVIIDLMKRGIITSLSLNGAGIIHDFELALIGQTSEDVDKEILSGAFGMAEETGSMINNAVRSGAEQGLSIGEAVGRMVHAGEFPYKDKSLLAAGARLSIPVTVHVAIGTDIIHMHPSFDGKATGEAAARDFRKFCSLVADLGNIWSKLDSAELFVEADQPKSQVAVKSITPEQIIEITGPPDSDGNTGHTVFEDQVPAGDPSQEFSQRGIRVGIGRAGHGNHG